MYGIFFTFGTQAGNLAFDIFPEMGFRQIETVNTESILKQ